MDRTTIKARSLVGEDWLELDPSRDGKDPKALLLNGAEVGKPFRRLLFKSLRHLISNMNKLVTYDELRSEVWSYRASDETIRHTVGEVIAIIGKHWIQCDSSNGFIFRALADPSLPDTPTHASLPEIIERKRSDLISNKPLGNSSSQGNLPTFNDSRALRAKSLNHEVGTTFAVTSTQPLKEGLLDMRSHTSPVQILKPEVIEYFDDRRVSVAGTEWCVQLVSMADVGGWTEDEVRFIELDKYEMPEVLRPMLADYPIESGAKLNDVYSLFDYSDLISDQGSPLVIQARPVSYGMEFSYLEGGSISVHKDCPARYRGTCEALFSLKQSPLVHALAAHIIVLSKERDGTSRIVLNRRSDLVHFFPSTWSVSLEEHMLAKHHSGRTKRDKHPWDTARRGLKEELGVTTSEIEQLRLVGLYLEFNVWTVPMVFIAECSLSFREMVERWPTAADPHESRVIDSIPATVEAIDSILSRGGDWSPSDSAWYMNDQLRRTDAQRIGLGLPVATALHNTSALRLHLLREYLTC